MIFKWAKNLLEQLYNIHYHQTFENVPHNENDDPHTGFNRNVLNMEEDY